MPSSAATSAAPEQRQSPAAKRSAALPARGCPSSRQAEPGKRPEPAPRAWRGARLPAGPHSGRGGPGRRLPPSLSGYGGQFYSRSRQTRPGGARFPSGGARAAILSPGGCGGARNGGRPLPSPPLPSPPALPAGAPRSGPLRGGAPLPRTAEFCPSPMAPAATPPREDTDKRGAAPLRSGHAPPAPPQNGGEAPPLKGEGTGSLGGDRGRRGEEGRRPGPARRSLGAGTAPSATARRWSLPVHAAGRPEARGALQPSPVSPGAPTASEPPLPRTPPAGCCPGKDPPCP